MKNRNKLTATLVALLLLLLPAIASATHFEGDVVFDADCSGWSADGIVKIRLNVPEANLATTITITPQGGQTPVLTLVDEVVLPTDEDRFVDMNLGDLWNNMTEEIVPLVGTYNVHAVIYLSAPWPGGLDEETIEFDVLMACDVVANQDISWGSFKSVYR